MNLGNVFTVTCTKCGRKQQLAAGLIAKRRNCAYCGGVYQIPPEAEEQAKALTSNTPLPQGKPMNLTCAVCLHQIRYASVVPGQLMACKFCSAPFRGQEEEGVTPLIEPTYAVPSQPVQLLCPWCKNLTPVPGNALAPQATCGPCQKSIDLVHMPIEKLVGVALMPPPTKVAGVVRAALAARWTAQKLCPGEATEILFPLALIEGWTPPPDTGNAAVSPLQPGLTAELTKYLIFGTPDATVNNAEGGATRMMIKLQMEGGFPWERMISGPMIDRIRNAVTPLGNMQFPSKNRPDPIRPLIYLTFRPCPDGCWLSVDVQKNDGQYLELEPGEFVYARKRIRDMIVSSMHAFLAFRSLHGMWASIGTMQSAHIDSVAGRLASLGGEYQNEAVSLAKSILAR
jgi:hypothetical protein